MIVPSTLDLLAQRHAPFVYDLLFEGIDLSAASFWLQVRLVPDAAGSALINLVNAPAGSPGISAVLSGSDTIVTIRIHEASLEALTLSTDPDLALSYDLQIEPLGGDREVYLAGQFVVEGCATFVGPPVPHRYWRLSVPHSADGDFFVDSNEIELRTTPGGSDVTTPSTTIAASDELAFSGIAANAIDDDTGTIWTTNASPTFPVTLTFDFGAGNAKAILEVSWLPRPDAPSRSPSELDVLWSDDGSSWHLNWSETGITGWTAGVAKVFTKP
jgi:hypothetical protein